MYCPSCGMEIDDNSKFCPTCGERLTDALNDMGIRYKNGDESAFQGIYEDTEGWVRSYVYNRVSANNVEDCMQQIYIKLYQNIQGFDYTKGQFRPWFNTLVKNETIDFLRRFEKPQIKDVDSLYDEEDKAIDIVDPGMSPEDVMEKNEIARIMSEILSEISEEQRQCIMLRYMEGLKNKEIAEMYGISEGTVKSRISYGLKRVEAKVIELEKQGTKLYGMAPHPFFAWLICYGNVAGLFITSNVWTGVVAATGTGIGVAASGAMSGTVGSATTGGVSGAVGSATTGGVSGAVGSAATTNGVVGMAATGEVATGTAIAPGAATVTGTTTVAGGAATTTAGATTAAGVTATAVATTGIKATILKVVLGTAIGTAVIGGGIGVKKLIDNKKQETTEITTEEEATEEIATVTDAEGETTVTDAEENSIVDEVLEVSKPIDYTSITYPDWIDAYSSGLTSLFAHMGHEKKINIVFFDMYEDGIPEIYVSSTEGEKSQIYEYQDGSFVCLNDNIDISISPEQQFVMYYNSDVKQALCMYTPGDRGNRICKVFYLEDGSAVADYRIDLYIGRDNGQVVGEILYPGEGYKSIEQEEVCDVLKPFFDTVELKEYKYVYYDVVDKKEEERIDYIIDFELNEKVRTASNFDYSLEAEKDETEINVDHDMVKQILQEYYVREGDIISDDWKVKYVNKLKEVVVEFGSYGGMSLIDMNLDGIPEMYLSCRDKEGVNEIYTYKDGEVILVECQQVMDTARIYSDGSYVAFCSKWDDKKYQEVEIMRLDGYELINIVKLKLNYHNGGGSSISIVKEGVETQVSEDEARELLGEYNLEFDQFRLEHDGMYYVVGNNTFQHMLIWTNKNRGSGEVVVDYLREYIMSY